VTINVLPDDVLLEIFDFYVDEDEDKFEYDSRKQDIEEWQTLVHVCRRWRTIVFGSTNRLELLLVCTSKTPARDTLDVWPALPLLIQDEDFLSEGADNIVAALECSDRVDKIHLRNVDGSPMETVLAAMQRPFPNLTYLELQSNGTVTVLPDSFLDGHAPNLEFLMLSRIPIPGLPSLLFHSTKLSHFLFRGIPHSVYFPPEEFVTCLPTLMNLQQFELEFESPRSRPDWGSWRPPPPTRSVLPSLGSLNFKGVSEYLDDLLVRIDAPRLGYLDITFFNQIDFDTPRLVQFISRTPRLNGLEVAHLRFGGGAAGVSLLSLTDQQKTLRAPFNVEILCRELDWQVSSLEQLCTSLSPFTSSPEELYIYQTRDSKPDWKDNADSALWLALLHPFTAVKNLHLSKEFAPRILPAFQELVGGRTTEVLPALQNIFIEEFHSVQEAIKTVVALEEPQPSPVQDAIETTVALEEPRPAVSVNPVQDAIQIVVTARQLAGHPVTASHWERDLELGCRAKMANVNRLRTVELW
jgi:hypothetical protein